MFFLWIPGCVFGQNIDNQQRALTVQQMSAKDRFEWRTVSLKKTIPVPQSIASIKQAIEGRTSLLMHSMQQWVPYDPAAFRKYSFLHWEMCGRPPLLPIQEKLLLRDFFNAGGTFFLDHCEGSFNEGEWKRWGASIFPESQWEELESSHVLAYSFYLLEKRMLLDGGHSSINLLKNDGRMIIILNQNSGFSWKNFRQSKVSKNYNSTQNEIRLRFYVNLLMYLLTGNYKADQLHLPTILLRRK
ncbi:MAG: DUF4159 domain-containing protein [SAR324 cluster bacterium]|nr:DUF4159 domain-containing protein [SAR324 cluster bacterium]